jgi:hypothetical protein
MALSALGSTLVWCHWSQMGCSPRVGYRLLFRLGFLYSEVACGWEILEALTTEAFLV